MKKRTRSYSLTDALKWYDDTSRQERVKRIEWASATYQLPSMVSGDYIPLSLMEEARVSFVNGQYMACVLCATSAIEHLLAEELEANGLGGTRSTLGTSIEKAASILPVDTHARLKAVNDLRNPIAHRRDSNDASTIANRFRKRQVHPDTLLEEDAKIALKAMYELFQLVIRPAPSRFST